MCQVSLHVYSTGQTRKSLDHWLQEHFHALKNGDVAISEIAEHVLFGNHEVDVSKASIIDAHLHTQSCCIM